MSFAIKCDKCGKYFDKYGHKRSIDGSFVRGIKIFTSGTYRECDLCENCVEDLYEFMGFDKDKNKKKIPNISMTPNELREKMGLEPIKED